MNEPFIPLRREQHGSWLARLCNDHRPPGSLDLFQEGTRSFLQVFNCFDVFGQTDRHSYTLLAFAVDLFKERRWQDDNRARPSSSRAGKLDSTVNFFAEERFVC